MSRPIKTTIFLCVLGLVGAVTPETVLTQGRCMTTYGVPACNTTDIPPVFAPTGWRTVALEQVTFQVADYKKEAAFYTAVMGWTLRRDDGTQAVMDVGDWGTVIFKQASATRAPAAGNTPSAVVT